jgi:thioredoxin-like negative regulator of GroEL
MGNRAFEDFLASIQAKIGILNNTVTVLEKRVASYKKKADAGDAQAAIDLAATEDDMKNKNDVIEALKAFFVTMKKDWSEVNDRIIGQVVWALPITGNNAPHGYTKDVCVIKLDKKKFWPNFKGNVIDLGAC